MWLLPNPMSSWYQSRQQQQHSISLRSSRNHQLKRNRKEIHIFAISVACITISYFFLYSSFRRSNRQPLPSDSSLLQINTDADGAVQRPTIPLDTPIIEFSKRAAHPHDAGSLAENTKEDPDKKQQLAQLPSDTSREVISNNSGGISTKGGYDYWRDVAVRLAKLTPNELLKQLETDPFETRSFESKLLQAETAKGAVLELSEVLKLFPCPENSRRITLPDMRNNTRAKAFRDAGVEQDFTFLFFQHLRKAGGTNFCTLAQKNMPRAAVPTYYCMPDRNWNISRPVCAGCLHQWTNEEISHHMKSQGHRIAGNEWDPFEPDRFFNLPAIFATSFRKPLDRALSQFRFECIEDRGCKILNVTEWWEVSRNLYNVYLWTFTNLNQFGILKVYDSAEPQDAEKRGNLVGQAFHVVARYNLVLIMEWLAYASPQVKSTLGFSDTSVLTQRVRPHIVQYQRKDGQDENKLGAAGVGKASWTPESYLPKELYKLMSENLALDMILNDAARRMFLERLVCEK
jgi:hypothetical protein